MRQIVFPEVPAKDCENCAGRGKLVTTGRQPGVKCPSCTGTGKVRVAHPDEIVFFALKPKDGEQGISRDQMRTRAPILRAVDDMADHTMLLQDQEWTLLKKCIDEREDWPFGLDVDLIITAIEDAEHVAAAEITQLSRPTKRALRGK